MAMPHRKLHVAARAAGFAMVNQDSFDNQAEFFVRLDKDHSDEDRSQKIRYSPAPASPTRSWLSSFYLRGSTA